jgi:hypothetical protein
LNPQAFTHHDENTPPITEHVGRTSHQSLEGSAVWLFSRDQHRFASPTDDNIRTSIGVSINSTGIPG